MRAEDFNRGQSGRLWTVADLPGELGQVAEDFGVNSGQFAAAVRQVQSAHGLKVDGLLGPRTWAALRSARRGDGDGEALTRVGPVVFNRPSRSQAPPSNSLTGVDGGSQRVADLWNQYGGAIADLAAQHDIPVGVALAVFVTEAGSSAYDRATGLVIIRFEQHLFNRMRGLPRARMRHAGQQLTEWNALQIAAAKDLEEAFRCTSFGLPQMMGFNCLAVGYGSAVDMALAFQDDVTNQVRGFFDFCKKGGLDTMIRQKDWQGFTRRYNGPGQVSHYSRVLENHLALVGGMGFDV